jgi:hypothetical protein
MTTLRIQELKAWISNGIALGTLWEDRLSESTIANSRALQCSSQLQRKQQVGLLGRTTDRLHRQGKKSPMITLANPGIESLVSNG